MRKISVAILAATLVVPLSGIAAATFDVAASAAETETSPGPVYTEEAGQTVALSGFDAVSYFIGDGVPQKGLAAHSVRYQGYDYRFASAENAETFATDPARYVPAYGGHCAWGMARGYLAPGDPTAYRIVDGRLYLNYNAAVQAMWIKDIPGFIAKADGNYPGFRPDQRYDDAD